MFTFLANMHNTV